MTSTTQARDISIEDLEDQFDVQVDEHSNFFYEWKKDFAEPTEFEKQRLERLQQNYQNLARRKNFSEESVKMVVLSPLLDLAGFYQAPFGLVTEEPVEIISEDEDNIVKGKIDVLVVRKKFWVLVIESKQTRFDVVSALPQAIAYMLDTPDKLNPVYGLLVNGREFVFLKLSHQPKPIYARSFALSIERDEELAQVLSTLKRLRQDVLANS